MRSILLLFLISSMFSSSAPFERDLVCNNIVINYDTCGEINRKRYLRFRQKFPEDYCNETPALLPHVRLTGLLYC